MTNWLGVNWGSSEFIPPAYADKDGEKQLRLERYQNAWEAYLAELPDPITVDDPDVNDNVKVNPARALINTSVYFLFGSEVKFQESQDLAKTYNSGDQTTAGEAPGYDTLPPWLSDLNSVWKANKKDKFFSNLGLSGAIHGDVFVKIVPNGAGNKLQYPRLINLDPANVDVTWDPNDCEREVQFDIEYTTVDDDDVPVLRIQRIKAVQDAAQEVTLSWTMQNFEQKMTFITNTGWVPASGEEVPVGPLVPWDYPWPPIVHAQNMELPHMYYGLPDLDESSVELIKALQGSMSSLNKIIRIHASPRMYAQGVMPDQLDEIDVSPDNIITLPNSDSDLKVLETLQNVGPSIDYTNQLRTDLYEMLQVPPIAMGKFENSKSALSGLTLAILYAPLLQKTELKRISYGELIDTINSHILELMDYEDDTLYEGLTIVWPESMPGAEFLERQTLQQDQAMGVSTHTILERLGYDPEEEQARKLKEQDDQMALSQKYAPPVVGPDGSVTKAKTTTPDGKPTKPGGDKNPTGKGNKAGSMGGVNSAGSSKTPKQS